jgi:hypothetical protein
MVAAGDVGRPGGGDTAALRRPPSPPRSGDARPGPSRARGSVPPTRSGFPPGHPTPSSNPSRPAPYARLLRSARCEYGDVARLVHRDGLDETLRTLACHGVYLTVEEFKGRRAVVRGDLAFEVAPSRLGRSRAGGITAQTSGSRGRRTTVDDRHGHHRRVGRGRVSGLRGPRAAWTGSTRAGRCRVAIRWHSCCSSPPSAQRRRGGSRPSIPRRGVSTRGIAGARGF